MLIAVPRTVMIPVITLLPDPLLIAVTLLLNAFAAMALFSINAPLLANWKNNDALGRLFTIKTMVFKMWVFALLIAKILSLNTVGFPVAGVSEAQPIVLWLVLFSGAVFIFTGIVTVHFCFVLGKNMHTRWAKQYLLFGYLWCAALAVIVLIWPHLLIENFIISRTLDIGYTPNLIGVILFSGTIVCWVYGIYLLIKYRASKMHWLWLSDALVLASIIVQTIVPTVVNTWFVSSLILLGALSVLYFYQRSDTLNLTRRAILSSEDSLQGAQYNLRRTQALNEVSQILTRQSNHAQAWINISTQVKDVIALDKLNIIIFDEDISAIKAVFDSTTMSLTPSENLPSLALLKQGILGWVLENRCSAISSGLQPDPRESEALQQHRVETGIGPILITPLIYQTILVGAILITRNQPADDFVSDDVAFLESVSLQIASMVVTQRATEQLTFALDNTQLALDRTQTLQNVSKAINKSLNQTDLLQAVMRETDAAIALRTTVVAVVDVPQQTILNYVYKRTGPDAQAPVALTRIWQEDSLIGWALQNKQLLISSKDGIDTRQSLQLAKERSTRNVGCIIVAPILHNNEVLGFITISRSMQQPDFSQADIDLLAAIADLTAVALHNSLLLEQQQQARTRAELMFNVAQTSTQDIDLDGLLNVILERYVQQVQPKWTRLHLLDFDEEKVIHDIGYGEGIPPSNYTFAELMTMFIGYCTLNRVPLLSQKGADDARHHAPAQLRRKALGIGSTMVAPLIHQNNVLGAISVYAAIDDKDYTDTDLDLLVALANQIASTISHFYAVEQVRQSENRFRALIQHAPDAILILDVEKNRFIAANPLACALFTRSLNEFLELDPIELYPKTDIDIAIEVRAEAIAHTFELGQFTSERLFITAEGNPFPAEVRLVALPGPNRLIRTSIVDITDRKQQDAAMLQSQKLESLGVMAGGIAHDFNNLLLAMMGQSQIAQRRMEEGHPARRNIAKIEKAAQRASELTRQMMAYSGRGQTTEYLAIDINALIDENAELLRATIPNTIQLHTEFDADLPNVIGERGQIQQVVMNMMINASEASGAETGDIWVKTDLYRPDITALPSWQVITPTFEIGNYVRLTFKDNGCGMSAETAARIFDPFFTTKHSGHGLGLAAVLGIIRSHSGSIRVQSEEGVGTAFEIVFPTDQRTQPTAAPKKPDVVLDHLAGRTILVIDDDEAVLETVIETLRSYGMQVHSALSGAAGIEMFKQHQSAIDLTLIDVSMPGISGVDTMRALHHINESLQVILSSGYNRLNADKVAEIEDNVAFLQKPYRSEQLLASISGVLAQDA